MGSYPEDFINRVKAHCAEPTGYNGVPWPPRPLEKWVLAWLECKAEHTYRWPRWAVAQEVTDATYAYHEYNEATSTRL